MWDACHFLTFFHLNSLVFLSPFCCEFIVLSDFLTQKLLACSSKNGLFDAQWCQKSKILFNWIICNIFRW